MKRCKVKLENKKECGRPVMVEPDHAKEAIRFMDKKGKAISTVAFPTKQASHGMCFYHFNMARSKAAMEKKMEQKRILM